MLTVFMQDLYVAMVSGSKRAFKSMFNQLLVEDNYPIVLSCINGKDYTGFAVSLLLSAFAYTRRRYHERLIRSPTVISTNEESVLLKTVATKHKKLYIVDTIGRQPIPILCPRLYPSTARVYQ